MRQIARQIAHAAVVLRRVQGGYFDRLSLLEARQLAQELLHGQHIAGVHRVRVHDLRHSHASLLINMGESPLLLKERLGHEKIQTTLGTYGHLYPNTNQAVAKKLTGILNYSEPKTSIANYTSNQHTADYHRA